MNQPPTDSNKTTNAGISPVVGAILMVAITVVLAAVILFFITGLADQPKAATGGISIENTPAGVEFQLIDAGNSDVIEVRANGAVVHTWEASDVGESVTVTGIDPSTSVTIVGTTDGSETVIRTFRPEQTYGSGPPTLVSAPLPANTTAPTIADCSTVYPTGDGSPGNPYEVVSDWGLQCMNQDLSAHYEVTRDIDATGTTSWNSGQGFEPVGSQPSPFTGSLAGNGHTIDGLTIDRVGPHVGLFGYANGASVTDFRLTNVDIQATQFGSGSVAGYLNGGTAQNLDVSGTMNGADETGGVIGGALGGASVSDISSTTTVTGAQYVGGAIGRINVPAANIQTTGSVSGDSYVGGVIGEASFATFTNLSATGDVSASIEFAGGVLGGDGVTKATVTESYATGDVTSPQGAGGLAGQVGDVSNSYATGTVTGDTGVGGLVGQLADDIENSYATGDVSGTNRVGGLLGFGSVTMTTSYATGSVTGSSNTGGLIGSASSTTVTDSYWDTTSTGQATSSGGGTGLTTSQMQGSSASTNMSGFDFTTVWQTNTGDYPSLR